MNSANHSPLVEMLLLRFFTQTVTRARVATPDRRPRGAGAILLREITRGADVQLSREAMRQLGKLPCHAGPVCSECMHRRCKPTEKGGRRLVRRYGNYSTDCRSLGVGSDRDLTGYRQGGLLEGPQLGYRGRTGGRRPVQSPRLPGSRELHQRMRRGRPSIQRVLGMGPGPQQHRRAEQGTNLMQSIRRRLPGRRLDM